jgi:DNA-binding NtrC family response regulator
MTELMNRPWRGNVRELFNVLEDAFSASQSGLIETQHLSPLIDETSIELRQRNTQPVPTFEETERSLIQRALMTTGGNKVLASRLLGISRKKLYARLAKYALNGVTAAAFVNAVATRPFWRDLLQ